MKIFAELLDGGTKKTQKKKKVTLYCISVTLALIAVMLVILASLGVASLVSGLIESSEQEAEAPQITVGATEPTTLSEGLIYSGNLLILDGAHRYQGDLETMIIRSYEGRPKTQTGSNVYSIISSGTDESVDFRGTPEAIEALNLMLADFYAAKSDDNVCITRAYTLSAKDTVNALYSAATSFELSYYFEYPGEVRGIYGVEKYEWIYANAHKYGFINVDNPSAEEGEGSGIFRYVGAPHATYMKTKRLTLSSYLEQLKTATPEAPLLIKIGRVTYASYYLASDAEHLVPTDYKYTVSGNNADGYIITASINKTSSQESAN